MARATAAFARRLRALLLAAAALGALSAGAGIALQGAVAGATSVWTALDTATFANVLETRFGSVWGLGLLAWAAVGTWTLVAGARMPVLRTATLGATGLALPPDRRLAALAVPLVLLAFLPALGGHAAAQSPQWLLIGANVIHVVAISAWVGGVAVLVVAVRAATAGLTTAADRTRLLVVTVGRFSTLAGVAVALVLLSGIVQSLVSVASWGALLDTAYGRSVLINRGCSPSSSAPAGRTGRGPCPPCAGRSPRRPVRARRASCCAVCSAPKSRCSWSCSP